MDGNGWFFKTLTFSEMKKLNQLIDSNLNFKKDGTLIQKRTIKENRYSKIPSKGGIYVYYDRNKIPIYVGRTKNLRKRHSQHMKDGISSVNKNIKEIMYYSYSIIEDISERNIYEMIYICTYKPKLNNDEDTGLPQEKMIS